jgi:hypothetical protein
MTYKNKKKLRNLMRYSARCSLLRAGGYSVAWTAFIEA